MITAIWNDEIVRHVTLNPIVLYYWMASIMEAFSETS